MGKFASDTRPLSRFFGVGPGDKATVLAVDSCLGTNLKLSVIRTIQTIFFATVGTAWVYCIMFHNLYHG